MLHKALVFFVLFLLVSCAPRGETRSLDEVLHSSKQRYLSASQVVVKSEVAPALQKMNGILDGMLSSSGSQVSTQLKEGAEVLSVLVERSGYTSRPAFGELMNQYSSLAAGAPTPPELKLLASRTYSLLAGELETMRFAL